MNEAISEAISRLINTMIVDYDRWQTANGTREKTDIQVTMYQNYSASLTAEVGRKYIKIVSNGSVKAFVVNTENDKNFRYGDILKPAGWAAPARNFARGNVFEDFNIRWTGA